MQKKKLFKYGAGVVLVIAAGVWAINAYRQDKPVANDPSKAVAEEQAQAPASISPIVAADFSKVGKSGLFLSSQHARKMADMGAAGDFLKQFADKKDAPLEIIRYTYATLAMAGRIDQAAKYALVDLQAGGKDYLPVILVVADNAKNGNYKDALKVVQGRSLKGVQRHFNTMLAAWILMGDGQKDAALKKIDEIKNVKAFAGPYLFHKGLMLDLAGENKKVEYFYLKLIGESGEQASIRALQVLISFYRRTGQTQKAKNILKIYQADPEKLASVGEDFLYPQSDAAPVDSAAKGLGEVLLGMATNFMSDDEGTETAMLLLKTVLYLDDKNVAARVLLAEVLEKQKMIKAAISEYQKLPKNNQMYMAGLLKQYELFVQEKDYKKAKKVLLEAEKDDPLNPAVAAGLANIYSEEKNYEKAILYYDKAIDFLPPKSKAMAGMFASRAMVYDAMGKSDLAERDFVLSLEINPDDAMVLNSLGYIWLVQNKNIGQAKEMIAKAVQKTPDDGYIIDSFGWAFYLTGDYAKAISMLEMALELEPANSVINDHLGDAYWKNGRKREAAYQWEKALKFNTEITAEDVANIKTKLAVGLDEYEKAKVNEKSNLQKSKSKNKP